MSLPTLLLRLGLASLLGAVVGLERHQADKSAGIRTHLLVSLGSALIMIVSAYGFDAVLQPSRVALDPSRVAAQVVSGVGFLGAGTILRRQSQVYGLTTAAGLWVAAGIGLAVGGGLYTAAIVSTALILIALVAVKPLEDHLTNRNGHHRLILVTASDGLTLTDLHTMIKQAGMELKDTHVKADRETGEQRMEIRLSHAPKDAMLTLVDRLRSEPNVKQVSFKSRRP